MKKYIILVILIIIIGGVYINYQVKNEKIDPMNTKFSFTQDTNYQDLRIDISKEIYKLNYKGSRLTDKELEQTIQEIVQNISNEQLNIATDNGKDINFKIKEISSPDLPQNAIGVNSTSMENTVYFYK